MDNDFKAGTLVKILHGDGAGAHGYVESISPNFVPTHTMYTIKMENGGKYVKPRTSIEMITEMAARHRKNFHLTKLFRDEWFKMGLSWRDLDPILDHLKERGEQGDKKLPNGALNLYWKHPRRQGQKETRGIRVINKFIQSSSKIGLIFCFDKEERPKFELSDDESNQISKAINDLEEHGKKVKEDNK